MIVAKFFNLVKRVKLAGEHMATNLVEKLGGKNLDLDILVYPVYACWVAIPALFSSINGFEDPNQDFGIHVHARKQPNQPKTIDDTFDIVNIHYQGIKTFG